MSKVNNILKKADFFEKIAMFGNRKAFLSSFAQAFPPGLTDPTGVVVDNKKPVSPKSEEVSDDYGEVPEPLSPDEDYKGSYPTNLPSTTEETTSPYVSVMQIGLINLAKKLDEISATKDIEVVYEITKQDILNLKNIGTYAKSKEDGRWGPLTTRAVDIADNIAASLNIDVYEFAFDKNRNAYSARENSDRLSKMVNYLSSPAFTKEFQDKKGKQLGEALESFDKKMQERLQNGKIDTDAFSSTDKVLSPSFMPESI